MISYKVKGIILAVIISLASIMMPFSIYADSLLLGDIQGMQLELIDTSVLDATGTYPRSIYTYRIVVKLRDNYLGYARMSIPYSYYSNNGQTNEIIQGTTIPTFYFNGDSSSATFTITAKYLNDPIIDSTPQYSIESSSVVKISEIDNIQQIIDILQDVYQNSDDIEGLQTNMLSELQSVVSNTSLANQYLDQISLMRQWDIYTESIPLISYYLTKGYSYNIDYTNSYYNYPLFILNSGDTLVQFNSSSKMTFVFYCRPLFRNTTDIDTYYNLINCTVEDVTTINEIMFGNNYLRLYKITLKRINSGGSSITAKATTSVIPIYLGYSTSKYISTEFALQFGLSNSLLDNVQIIANGTTQSNSAVSDLEQEASEYSEIADDVIGVEEGLTSNFETEVNKIDLNTGLNVFGGNFMTSATWVRTQFDRLTENTPYGSLVVYGLTLGFALLMLGKVFL